MQDEARPGYSAYLNNCSYMSPRAPVNDDTPCQVTHLTADRLRAVRALLLPADQAVELAETFKLLGDLTRVKILDALAQQELCVCDLATLVGLSESAVSHQLRLLRNMRLVRARRAGRMVFYALDDHHILSLLQQASRHVGEPEHPGRARRGA